MFTLKNVLALLVCLHLTVIKALIFPLEREEVGAESGLVPSLPRPMFTEGDTPFRFLANVKPYVAVHGTGTLEQDYDDIDDNMNLDEEMAQIKVLKIVTQQPNRYLEEQGRYINLVGEGLCDSTDINQQKERFGALEFDLIPVTTKPLVSANGDAPISFVFNATLDIKATGYHQIALLNCGNRASLIVEEGAFDFRNPHGYLPGGWYLKLPLTLTIIIGYSVFIVRYVIRCCMYRDQILYLQYGIVIVLGMALIEQLSYYFTFLEINSTGALPCCPVRNDIGFCLIVSVLKRATLVIFLLAVSLGYGTQRPYLTKKEIFAVAAMGVTYVVAAVNYELKVIQAAATNEMYFYSAMLVSLLNLIVISWIYLSITKLTSELKNSGQLVKLEMYQSLARALILWVVVGFLSEILFYSLLSSTVVVPWKFEMVPTFTWDLLFLALVMQIGLLWFPSEMTSQYAYSKQIPQMDDDDFSDDKGIEMGDSSFVIGEEEEEEEEEFGEFDNIAQT